MSPVRARGRTAARREHGYCLDDVARGLVVLSREPWPELARLQETFLAFTAHGAEKRALPQPSWLRPSLAGHAWPR